MLIIQMIIFAVEHQPVRVVDPAVLGREVDIGAIVEILVVLAQRAAVLPVLHLNVGVASEFQRLPQIRAQIVIDPVAGVDIVEAKVEVVNQRAVLANRNLAGADMLADRQHQIVAVDKHCACFQICITSFTKNE